MESCLVFTTSKLQKQLMITSNLPLILAFYLQPTSKIPVKTSRLLRASIRYRQDKLSAQVLTATAQNKALSLTMRRHFALLRESFVSLVMMTVAPQRSESSLMECLKGAISPETTHLLMSRLITRSIGCKALRE